jgi:PAS domain S-box-containing protein
VRRALGRPWLLGALLAEAALFATDMATPPGFFTRALHLLPVLVVAARAGVRDVAIVGAVAVAMVVANLAILDSFADEDVLPLAVVALGSAIALWVARARQAAEAERRQMRLLADAAQITDGAADIEEALRRLVALLVPDLVDAAWIDVITPGGGLRRLAARADGADAAEIERWLLERPQTAPSGTLAPSAVARGGGGPTPAVLDTATIDAIASGAEDPRLIERSGMRMTMTVPLAVGGRALGVLSLGVGRSGRRFGDAELAFADLLAGRAALALANAQLVDRLSAAQRRLDGILGALTEAVTVHSAEGRIVYANPAAAAVAGLRSVEELLAMASGELAERYEMTRPDGSPLRPDDLPSRRVARGEAWEPQLVRSVVRATGQARWFMAKATPLRDESGELLAVNVLEDVTEEHEARLREDFLTEAGKALASSLDYGETLQRVARLAVPRLADWCAVELPDDRGVLQLVALAHADPERVAEARALRERYPPDPAEPAGAHAVLRSGRSELYSDITDEMLIEAARDAEHLERTRRLDPRSVMIVPMTTGGRTLGVMTFLGGGGRRYAADDLPFAEELAARAATAVENARLYTERSDVALTLQASLLPEQLPQLDGWRATADYRAGQVGTEVGGDFYDVFRVEGGSMVILGDVTGKGVAAAALTSLVRHTAKTGAYFDARPSAVLALVNRALRRQPRVAPVTMLCGLLRERELTLAVGGHPLPLLKPAGAPPRKVGEPGLLLGAVDDYPAVQDVPVVLAPGDTMLLYTDGVTDTPGDDGRFGEARLCAAVETAPGAPEALLARLRATLAAYQRGTVMDDRAMLALQYLGSGISYDAASSSSTVPSTTALTEAPFSK